jgi:RNA polymerase sigma-70 factor (ECF subfamily)
MFWMPPPALVSPLPSPDAVPSFEDVYQAHASFVWRSLRRLGVAESSLDDATQDVFVVVHRRLSEFEGRSQLTTWLYRIAYHTAQHYFRHGVRHPSHAAQSQLESQAELPADTSPSHISLESANGLTSHASVNSCPQEVFSQKQAVERLYAVLDQLDDEKRAVFVMAELEQMAAPEIANVLRVPVNTVYSRLRAARLHFNTLVDQLTRNERMLP